MNRAFSFLIAFFLILAVGLFHFEAPQTAPSDIDGKITTDAMAASNEDGMNSDSGFGLTPSFLSLNNNDSASTARDTVFDPVTIILLGSGMIGLAGLGRKKR
jgi:hypothetical protein